jgi:hypothetical protein
MNPNRLLLATLLACLMQPALTEEDPAPGPAPRVMPAPGPEGGLRVIDRGNAQGNARRNAQVVKNAPYSAQAVSERLQQLPDGNQIEWRTRSASYRDSAGRTRHEISNDKGELRTVTISDPVAGTAWILHPQTRIAQRTPTPAEIARIARDARETARAQVERMSKDGRLPALERHIEERVSVDVERALDHQRETVRVIRLPGAPGMDAGVIGSQLGTMLTRALADTKWADKVVSRDLGTREFEGVKAEGKLRSFEIPAGELGNRNPIVVADETWYSPELQATVYSKHSDPRSGDYIYRLEGIKRGEPDAALFTAPPDYQVRETGKRITRAPRKSGE